MGGRRGPRGGTALAAVALLPFLELLRDSGDVADRAGRSALSADLRSCWRSRCPSTGGAPRRTPTVAFINSRAFYAGALPLMLAALAVALRPTRERVAVAVAGVGALLVVFGIDPLFRIVTALPGFAQAHNTRLAVVACLALALLAGWGLDELVGGRLHPSRRLAAFLAAVVALPLVAVALGAPWEAGALGEALEVAWGFADGRPRPRPEWWRRWRRRSSGSCSAARRRRWCGPARSAGSRPRCWRRWRSCSRRWTCSRSASARIPRSRSSTRSSP